MANDAVLLTNFADMMTEMMVQEQLVFGFDTPLLAEIGGLQRAGDNGQYVYTRDPNQQRFTKAMDFSREVFKGKQVTVPLQLDDVSSAAVAEGGTWIDPAPFSTDQATYTLKSQITPIALTIELEEDARDGQYSAMSAVAGYTASAYRAAARLANDFLHGSGDGLLQSSTSANADADGLVMTVGTAANFDRLTPGRIVNVLVKATGADPGQGKRRKIASVDRSAGTVTFSTTQVASDGGTGNITLSTNDLGIYADSSFAADTTGITQAGLGNVTSTTDTTYGGISKAAVAQWKGVSVDAGAAQLDDSAIESALYFLSGNGVGAPDFGIAHNLTVDPYKASKTSLVRIQAQTAIVPSGFKGIVNQSGDSEFPILKDRAAPRKVCRLVTKSSLRIYGRQAGPSLINDDNTTFRFFNRNSKKEADLFDRWQLCARDCGKNAEITNLAE